MLQPKRLASTIIACNTVIAGVLIAPNTAAAAESVFPPETETQQQVSVSNKAKETEEPTVIRYSSVEVADVQEQTPEQQSVAQEFIQQQVKEQPVQIQQPAYPSSVGTTSRSVESVGVSEGQSVEPEVVDLRSEDGANDWSKLQEPTQQVQQQVEQFPTQQVQQELDPCGATVSFQQQASIQQSVNIGQQQVQEPCPIKGKTPTPPCECGDTPEAPGEKGDTPRVPITPRSTPELPGEEDDTPEAPGEKGDTPRTPGGSSGFIIPLIIGGSSVAAFNAPAPEAPKAEVAPVAKAAPAPVAKEAPAAQPRMLANTGADAGILMVAAMLLTLTGFGLMRARKS